MTPRLNRQARQHLAQAYLHGKRRGFRVWRSASRPSPAEKRKARTLAHAMVRRSMDRVDNADLHIAYMTGRMDRDWPESRGTTAQQLTAMHLEAEGIDVPRPGIL